MIPKDRAEEINHLSQQFIEAVYLHIPVGWNLQLEVNCQGTAEIRMYDENGEEIDVDTDASTLSEYINDILETQK